MTVPILKSEESFSLKIFGPTMYHYLLQTNKAMSATLQASQQHRSVEKPSWISNFMKTRVSDPMYMIISAINKLALVIYFCRKLQLRRGIRKVTLDNKVTHFKIQQKSVT